MHDQNTKYLLGIDGGGTKCKAIITNMRGVILGTGISGPANPLRGLTLSQNSILAATQQALLDASLAPEEITKLVAGIGLAGINMPHLMQQLKRWKHPFKQAWFTTDMHIACLGAHQGQDGAIIISGTGSSAIAVVEGKQHLLGGHGFLLGDQGSGAWLGLAAIRVVLKSMDGLAPETCLTQLVKTKLATDDLLLVLDKVSQAEPAFFADFAPLVFQAADSGDHVALNLVHNAADYIQTLTEQLLSFQPPGISLIGGLAKPLSPWLSSKCQSQLSQPVSPPEIGAILFAQQQLTAENTK